jgi:hypothetical protein
MFSSPWSDDDILMDLELGVELMGDSIVLLGQSSDRLSSSVEGKPLSIFTSEVVSDVESVLA